MKLCVTLLKVVLVVVFIEVVLGDIEGGDQGANTLEGGGSSGTKERVCPPELVVVNNSSFSLKAMPSIVIGCYEQIRRSDTSIGKRSNSSGDATETKVHEYCDETSTQHLQCLAEYAARVEDCPDKIFFKILSILHDYVGEVIESGCAQNGQRFITLFKELDVIEQTSPRLYRVKNEKFKFNTIISELDKSTIDVPSKLFIWHRQIKAHVEYINTIEMGQSFKEIMNYFADHLISHIKCVHPIDGTLVTCISIDATSFSEPNQCLITSHGKNHTFYDILEHDAVMLFENTMTLHTRDEDEIQDNEKGREDFKQYCSTNASINSKLRQMIILSEMCLNSTREKNQFKVLSDSINNAFEVACADEGKRFADIMLHVDRYTRASRYHEHPVWYCIDSLKASREGMGGRGDLFKNTRFYHELKNFKECFLHKLHGDRNIVSAATSLLDEMLKVIKCTNTENGPADFCKYMIDNGIPYDH